MDVAVAARDRVDEAAAAAWTGNCRGDSALVAGVIEDGGKRLHGTCSAVAEYGADAHRTPMYLCVWIDTRQSFAIA